MRPDPPRHIGDIAHLYLSRMRPRGESARVLVAGVNADLMPGFHAANLALAAAARRIPTRVEDASGLPANAGCFLALPPRAWVAGANGRVSWVMAFARVTFALAPEPAESDARSTAGSWAGLEIVHVPPWDTARVHAAAIAREAARGGRAVVLYLAERDAEPWPWREVGRHADVTARVAFVTRAGRGDADGACVGTLTRWTRALGDPLPVAVRDPGSLLARQYDGVVSNLLAGAAPAMHHQPRLRPDSPHAAEL